MNISLSPSMPGEKEFAELKFFATCRGVQEQARPDREQLFLLIFSLQSARDIMKTGMMSAPL